MNVKMYVDMDAHTTASCCIVEVNNDTHTEALVMCVLYTVYFIVQPLFAVTLIDKA